MSINRPAISERARNASSFVRSVPPAGSGASSATFEESVTTSVFRPCASALAR
jgi:hypothetical protein